LGDELFEVDCETGLETEKDVAEVLVVCRGSSVGSTGAGAVPESGTRCFGRRRFSLLHIFVNYDGME
jgi:hypothetical protein